MEKGQKQIKVKKLSLPVKYIVGLVLVIIILLVSSYLYYNQLRNSLDTNYQSSIRLIAQTQNHKINEWYRNWLNKLNTIVKDSSITHFINLSDSNPEYSTLKGNIETQLRSYLAENDFGNIDIVNIDSKTIYSAGVKLGENSNIINSGLNIINGIVQIDSYYFIVSDKNEIRLVVKAPIKTDGIKIGTAYVEINIDKVFGSPPNNILTKSNSDIDIYFVEGMNLTSLRKLFYKNLNLKDEEEFETILSYSDFVLIKNNEGFLSFKDSKTNEQFVYAINNPNTGWIITTRDKNKEKYYYLIEQLSSYIVFGLAILIIISALVLILWKKTLMFYSTAVKNDFEIVNLKNRFDHFSKFSQDIFFLLDKHGNIVDFNDKALKVYGYAVNEFKELNIRDLRTIKERNKTDGFFKFAEKSNGLIFDTTHQRKDKTEFDVEVSLRQVKINGEIFIQNIARDISERKSAEKRLKEKEEIFELIVSNLKEVVYIFSIKPTKKIEFISQSIESLTGYLQKDFYSDPSMMIKILHPEERYKIKMMIDGKLEENRPPVRIVRKDGETIWLQHRSIARKDASNNVVAFIGIFRDVTQQIQSELLLRKSEESFRYLFDNNPLPMWLYNFKSKQFLNINEAAINHYGYAKDEFLSLKLNEVSISHKSEITDDNILMDIIKSGKTIECLHTIKNGNIISVEVNSNLLQQNGSDDYLVLDVLQDITERKKIEARIVESEQRFKTLAKISPVAIFRTNSRGELTYMNENWAEMTGIFPEIAFGRKWWEGLPTKDKDLIEINWKRSIQVSNHYEAELELINPKSKVKWVLAGIVKITSGENKVIGYVGTLTDITKLKMFEGNFRKLYYSVEQSPVSIVITDTKGNIEFVNPAVIKTTGYTKEELIGSNPRVIKSDVQNKSFYQNLWDTISSGKIWQGEFYNKRKDGSFFWEQASISPVFNERNEITNYVAVKEDITAKKNLHEELIKAKNEALESSRIKTNFLAKINHELRTPLLGIIGCAHSISEEAENDRLKDIGDLLIKETGRLNDSLKSILSLSSLETEQQNFSIEPVGISSILKNIYQQYLILAKNKNLSFAIKDFQDDIFVEANNGLIIEIISNLVDNAIKFTEKGSVIIFGEIKSDQFILSIKDSGIGISGNSKEIIFEPFRQAEGLTKQSGGIGLGLTLAKKYASIINCKLWFESEINKGSTFYLSLPLTKKENIPITIVKPAFTVIEEKNVDLVKKKLLLVEDDDINLQVTRSYLRNLFEISVAENSTIALEQVAKNKFDIILMDIGLKHGLNGIELTKIIRKMTEYSKVPIIAVTAYTLAKDKEDIFNAGCSHYLAKPFLKEELINIVNVALS